MSIIRVALDKPLNILFDYLAPAGVTKQDIGCRVFVPFGKGRMAGVIMEVASHSDISPDKIKQADQVFRDVPPLPPELLDLFRFCSEYYHHPLGEVVMNGLPARLRSSQPFFIRTAPAIFQYRLTAKGRAVDISAIPGRSIAGRKLLVKLKESGMIEDGEAKQFSRRTSEVMKEFVALQWVEEIPVAPPVVPASSPQETQALPVLTTAQKNAIDAIVPKMGEFNTWLLHGVTGSGKTEIYLRLISLLLRQARQTLVLVPEINLTPQLEAIFRARFPGVRLASLHSGLNPTERAEGWVQAQLGEAEIILGTRLAVFTPLPRLGMIIVDEEHDLSFKQQEGLRYSARDVAVFRAKRAGIPIVLGSATPSLETYYNAITRRYLLLRLPSRAADNASLPTVHCIDIGKIKTQEGFSPPVITALEKCLASNQQSLVFINRRGYAPILLCRACGWTAVCHRCASRLVVHLREKKLRCHHCGHQAGFPSLCPECGNQDIAPFGHGTQRIEAALTRLFPHARIARIDRDSTRRKNSWQRILKDIREQRVDMLVGTQILAKGHDFPNLSLVSILNPDASLFSTDFRASERLFAQLMQVAGRAGRSGTLGEVLIQTEFPDHPLYRALRQHDYDTLARMLLEERKTARFPPFVHQALLRADAPAIATALAFLANAATMAKAPHQIEVFDPVPAQMARLKGMERAYLLVQSRSRKKLQEFLGSWRTKLDSLPSHKVRWTLDIDPLEF
ncbi:replication restart DNA helicase PriA [Nitrosospira multiformis]|uniref:Replication restart protein PriA n=1 Tax=Nitrosospira multiformis TaxID=1231 RepID=A0A2T5IBS7_9PROT|nr:primosomal protein N' [Nitrosospira multiformis]PTQ81272.1 replication restart DNA helicase PriA [Nitrosospira multiformis]